MNNNNTDADQVAAFKAGKPAHSLALFDHFIALCQSMGGTTLYPTKTMIGIGNGDKRAAWITQIGKNFVHIVLPFPEAYNDNLCFQKIAQVPGQQQYNHHLRIYNTEDFNEEVRRFLRLALDTTTQDG